MYAYSDAVRRVAYEKYKGKWQNILDVVILARDEDVDRFADIIQAAIDDGSVRSVPLFPAFKKKPTVVVKKRSQKKMDAEAKAADDLMAQIRGRNGPSAAMAKRSANLDSLVAKLEGKYDNKPTKKQKASKSSEPSEADFLAAQRRLQAKLRK
ncbi:hypothetical protein DYB37_009289 [Aphanomyces astaci]|uniref:DNAJC9 HTH domain-containing protein n=1 Tax=Aphanomyces astaci TaxID=112090 RepID=A0A397AYK8_APHAT|nr:hypothetical protein DYB36_002306 [Aphanomyces astaci]RHY37341.1 hypothetical protein DYB25_009207 [Aphanomyces astaci]RHY42171.1 hypothetical protein DYB34_002865 [Aphanomyces astaci]RHY47376.1 hypothetical protein DYB30_010505 [Aphanomyces astaci]RHY60136.1 hypothetical protein DYB38_004885 [Aphanomyces astaci]